MISFLTVFVLVYCLVIISALLMPKKWHNRFFKGIDNDASFKEYNYKYAYYKGVVFYAGVARGAISLLIKAVFY